MKKKIELENWNRKDHFAFFSQFEEPFFGVTVNVDCTRTYESCKNNDDSFFLKYLHCSLKAANSVTAFKLRIQDGDVYEFDQINASPTILRDDMSFGFSYMDYHPNFEEFQSHARKVIDAIKKSSGLFPATSGEAVIHYSSLPWLKFTALSHARSFTFPDSAPKISFGKMFSEGQKKMMPMSVHVHHALVDGNHVGEYVERLETLL